MDMPRNRFKAALREGRQQIGIWNTLGGNTVPELLAGCGFDWVLVDTEHSPVEACQVMPALQAISGYPDVSAVVRPDINDVALIKRYLDMGAQTLLIPYVQTPEEAEAAVRAVRYPPRGVRGVGGLVRASRFGKVADYVEHAEEELCLLVQVETQEALSRLEEIAGVDGVDGVFIGPADLAASMGHRGQAAHLEVVAAIEDAIGRLKKTGVPAGILTVDPAFARRCVELGTIFTAVGIDMALMLDGLAKLSNSVSDLR